MALSWARKDRRYAIGLSHIWCIGLGDIFMLDCVGFGDVVPSYMVSGLVHWVQYIRFSIMFGPSGFEVLGLVASG